MSVEFEEPVVPRAPRKTPWIVSHGLVKSEANARRLLVSIMLVCILASCTIVYFALRSADASQTQTIREVDDSFLESQ